ncbi:MAG UNVERIFIED_CONTAM: hypothetical protein LVR29_11235 [Microcystis novacekii LVE1205-3]
MATRFSAAGVGGWFTGRLTLTAVGVPGVAAFAVGGLGGRAVERVKLGY